MKSGLILSTVAAISLAACSAMPGGGPKTAEEHSAHHAGAAGAPADAPPMDGRMKRMQDMHAKMQAAKTPEERTALMNEHMKAMQDGMAMMGQMKGGMGMGGGMGMSMGGGMKPPAGETAKPMMDPSKAGGTPDAMGRRMDAMEMMMQMMMDREGVKPPAGR